MTINKLLYSLFFLIPITMGIGSFIPDLLLSLIALIFLIYSFTNKLWKYYRNNFFYLLIVFWFVLIIGSLLSDINEFPGYSIIETLKSSSTYIRFIIFSIAIYYLSSNYPNFYEHTYYSFLISLFVALFFSYFQLFTGYMIFFEDLTPLFISGFKDSYERISGLFGDELVLGGFLMRTLPLFCLFFFLSNRLSAKDTYLFILIFVLTTLMIFFAGERTALALLVLFLGLLFIFLKEYRAVFTKIGILLLIIVSIVLIFKKDIRERYFVHTFEYGFFHQGKINLFSTQHEMHYLGALRIFLDYPIQGSGVKMFRHLCAKEKYREGIEDWVMVLNENGKIVEWTVPRSCGTHPHNTWIQILSESGIMSFSLFLLFYFFVIKQLYYLYLKKKHDHIDKGKIILLLFYFVVFWPIIPTGNFFNNWMSISYYLPLGVLFKEFINKEKITL